MLYKVSVAKTSNGFQFLGRMRQSTMVISSNQRMKYQILVAGVACVACDRRKLVKITQKCRTIVHQRLPVRK